MGGYYGARLIEAGQDVTFLVRERRAALLKTNGLVVESALGSFNRSVETIVAGDSAPNFDLILLACKAYDLQGAIDTLVPLVGPTTAILPILNGLSAYTDLDFVFGKDHVMGGVSYIATTLGSDGRIVHQGSNDTLIVGARSPSTEEIAKELYEVIQNTPGHRQLSDSIDQMLWNKWSMIAAGAAVTCLLRGNISEILATNDGIHIVRSAIAETTKVAEASGYSLPAAANTQISNLLLSPTSTWQASMARDIAAGVDRLEADAIVGDMLMRGERLGLDLPLMRAAYCHLQVYEEQHAGT